jgi:hypothetical protein
MGQGDYPDGMCYHCGAKPFREGPAGYAICKCCHDKLETAAQEYAEKQELIRLREFAAQIARMNYDGEEREDDEDFIMENDDAVTTLSMLIREAREHIGETT